MAASFTSSFFPPAPIVPKSQSNHRILLLLLHPQTPRLPHLLHASSRRPPNYSQDGSLVSDSRNWRNGSIGDFVDEGRNDDDEDDDEDESEDRSLDLLVRFVQNVFRKISKRARKAVRSVLPVSISTKLVGFSVNGVIILAFLWVLKALLEASVIHFHILLCLILVRFVINESPNQHVEINTIIMRRVLRPPYLHLVYQVVCTFGSLVFVSILLIRGIWSGITYMQESRYRNANDFDDEPGAWNGAQPAG